MSSGNKAASGLLEIACVLVRFDHVGTVIEHANHYIMRADEKLVVPYLDSRVRAREALIPQAEQLANDMITRCPPGEDNGLSYGAWRSLTPFYSLVQDKLQVAPRRLPRSPVIANTYRDHRATDVPRFRRRPSRSTQEPDLPQTRRLEVDVPP